MMRLTLLAKILVICICVSSIISIYREGDEWILEKEDFMPCYLRNCTTSGTLKPEAARFFNPYDPYNQQSAGFIYAFNRLTGGYRKLLNEAESQCTTDLVPMEEYGPCCQEYTVQHEENICGIAEFFELDCQHLRDFNNLTEVVEYQKIQIC
eukprot:TRINITY_DN5771_c0_g1_i1.p3 TRINITY_DN5771_c0_g1~~TRINITY_DN5771_c0_g1_i1.p3  ORF type:complete len:152 (+),score=3.30 TRINITY_DN5771_c0_g1_i1:170-625(+)